MNVIEQYQDVLQNIEAAIMAVYRANPELTDQGARRAIEALAGRYVAEHLGRPEKPVSLSELEEKVRTAARGFCEWRLGRSAVADMPEVEPVTVEVMIQCLKRILKSIELQYKNGGRQGYLTFVARFVK